MTGEFKGSPLDAQTTNDYADFRRESVGNAFLEAAVFELALKTHGTANVHGQFVQGEFGKDTIIAPLADGKQGVFKATSTMELNYPTNTTTIYGDLRGAQGWRSVEIKMDRSHDQSVVVTGKNSAVFKTDGGWTPAPNNEITGHYTLSDANTVLAKVQGTREYLGSNHEKIQYTLYSPDDLKMTLGSIAVDKQLNDGVLTLDVTVNGK